MAGDRASGPALRSVVQALRRPGPVPGQCERCQHARPVVRGEVGGQCVGAQPRRGGAVGFLRSHTLFHDLVLTHGTLPMTVLAKLVHNWISAARRPT